MEGELRRETQLYRRPPVRRPPTRVAVAPPPGWLARALVFGAVFALVSLLSLREIHASAAAAAQDARRLARLSTSSS